MGERRLREKGWAAVVGILMMVTAALEIYFRVCYQGAPYISQYDQPRAGYLAMVIFVLVVFSVFCTMMLAVMCYKEHRTGWFARVLCSLALALLFIGHALNIQGGGLVEAEVTVPAQVSLPRSFDEAKLSLSAKDLSVMLPKQVRWHFGYSEDIAFNGWHFHVQKRSGDDLTFQLKNQPGLAWIYVSYALLVLGVWLWVMGVGSRMRTRWQK